MGSRKYVKDYRVEAHLGKGGRVRDVAVYCGDHFTFCLSKARVRRSLAVLFLLQGLLAATIFLPLLINCAYSTQMYLVLPIVFMLIPVYLTLSSLAIASWAKEPVIREQRDKIERRLPRALIAELVFAAVILVATVVFLCTETLGTTDWVFSGLAVLRVALSALCLRWRKDFAMESASGEPS